MEKYTDRQTNIRITCNRRIENKEICQRFRIHREKARKFRKKENAFKSYIYIFKYLQTHLSVTGTTYFPPLSIAPLVPGSTCTIWLCGMPVALLVWLLPPPLGRSSCNKIYQTWHHLLKPKRWLQWIQAGKCQHIGSQCADTAILLIAKKAVFVHTKSATHKEFLEKIYIQNGFSEQPVIRNVHRGLFILCLSFLFQNQVLTLWYG